MKDKSTARALLILFAGAMGVSTSAVFGRITTANGLITAMYRMLFTALLMLPAVLLKYRNELKTAAGRDIRRSMVSGMFLGGHFGTYLTSLKNTSIASSTVLVDTEVLFVALALLLIFRRRLKKAAVAGIILALAGSVIIALGDGAAAGSRVIFGDIMALLGAVCSAVYTMIGMKQRESMSTTSYTFIVYSAAAATLLLVSLATGQRFTGYPAADYLACLGMAVCCTLLGHSLFSYCLKYLSPALISTTKLLEPVFATLLGILFFAEYPGLNQIVGGLIVIGGIVLYVLRGRSED